MKNLRYKVLQILSKFKIEQILHDVRESEYFGLIMDETSSISRIDKALLWLSYIMNRERREAFASFFKAKSNTGKVPHKRLCDALKNLNLDMFKIVTECFDCASHIYIHFSSIWSTLC